MTHPLAIDTYQQHQQHVLAYLDHNDPLVDWDEDEDDDNWDGFWDEPPEEKPWTDEDEAALNEWEERRRARIAEANEY